MIENNTDKPNESIRIARNYLVLELLNNTQLTHLKSVGSMSGDGWERNDFNRPKTFMYKIRGSEIIQTITVYFVSLRFTFLQFSCISLVLKAHLT